MPTKTLSASATIDTLEAQARDLLRDVQAQDPAAFQRVREFHPDFAGVRDTDFAERTFSRSDAQCAIAREYGYASWGRVKEVLAKNSQSQMHLNHNDRVPDGPFKQALDFVDAGDVERLKAHLARHPGLVHETVVFEGGNYFANPTLLEFVPENPNRQGHLPPNAVDVASTLLVAGAKDNQKALDETVMLAASGRLCREHGVQTPLLKLLCANGADPNAGMYSALAHGEIEAAEVLLACGARLTLSTAAALDDAPAVERLVEQASQEELQLALALAANLGRAEIVSKLLQHGANPDLYNPPGGHSHCTALHSAVSSDQFATVQVLTEAGADLTIKDIHHNMTALGWAEYLKRDQIADYLRPRMQDAAETV